MVKKFTFFICLFSFYFLQAQQYEVDTTYGTEGIALHQLKGDKQSATDYIQLSNGKILVSGTTGIICINEDYTQDFSFGNNGKVRVSLDRIFERSDNKILGIKKNSSTNTLSIHCFLADGSYDTSFGIQGILSISNDYTFYKEYDASFWGAAIQDNQLLLALNAGKVIRITSQGSVDTSFGDNGVIKIPLPSAVVKTSNAEIDSRSVADIFVLSDGKIIFGANGYVLEKGTRQYIAFLLRYTADGILDTSFGNNNEGSSIIKHAIGSTIYNLRAQLQKIHMCKDGSIVALTEFQPVSEDDPSMFFSKISPDGKNNLGESVLSNEVGSPLYPSMGSIFMNYKDILELSDGKFVITAWSPEFRQYDVTKTQRKGALALLNLDGTYVSDFGTEGKLYLAESNKILESNAVGTLELKDGSLMTIGSFSLSGYAGDENYGLTLYNFDKKADPIQSFGEEGKKTYTIPFAEQKITTMEVQPDNKLLLGSSSIWRLSENGSLDQEFISIENEYANFGTSGSTYYYNRYVKVNENDGSIKTTGPFIRSYTKGGSVLYETAAMDKGSSNSNVVAIQPDGKYLYIRLKYNSPAYNVSVIEESIYRNNPDGTLDNSFTFDVNNIGDGLKSIALQGDKLLVKGNFMVYPAYRSLYSVVRFNSDGSYDPSFKIASVNDYGFYDFQVQSDQKILLYNGKEFSRLLPDGE